MFNTYSGQASILGYYTYPSYMGTTNQHATIEELLETVFSTVIHVRKLQAGLSEDLVQLWSLRDIHQMVRTEARDNVNILCQEVASED
jgi:hypothetical protein